MRLLGARPDHLADVLDAHFGVLGQRNDDALLLAGYVLLEEFERLVGVHGDELGASGSDAELQEPGVLLVDDLQLGERVEEPVEDLVLEAEALAAERLLP